MTKATVSSYRKTSKKGKPFTVRSHSRTVQQRGNYRIEKTRQLPHGSSSLSRDQRIQALDPGKRESKSNQTYYERRFNRSDSGDYL